jgi:CheY-like chemotaxis protein
MKTLQRRVLVVEDSREDFAALVRALNKSGSDDGLTISHSWDGDEALDTLHALVESGEIGRLPQVILLDLNLPGSDGREVITELKTDAVLRLIPIVVLTTSTNPVDIAECYRKGVNGYCVKGGSGTTFIETVAAFKKFWLEAAVLPPRPDAR